MPKENYAVRIRVPYESLRPTVSAWSLKAERVVVYEHPEDNNVHCHLLLYGVYDTTDNLKKIMWKLGVDAHGGGQLSFKVNYKDKSKTVIPITDETVAKYITYMSKGQYEPKYFNYYSQEYLDECKSKWVTYKAESIHEKLYSEYIIWLNQNKKILNMTNAELKISAIDFSKIKHGVISLAARRDAAMLIATYKWEVLNDKNIMLPFDLPEKKLFDGIVGDK